jgi:type IV pilus assembly protein PilN
VIKINLLAVDRERAKRKSAFQVGQKVTIGCSLILVATALLVGWWYWSLQRQSADLDQQIVEAERETVRLRSVIQQVQQFEARRVQLQQRVTLIEQLRKGQTGPVHLLDEVSRALPDTMWLINAAGATSSSTAAAVECAVCFVAASSVEPVQAAVRSSTVGAAPTAGSAEPVGSRSVMLSAVS